MDRREPERQAGVEARTGVCACTLSPPPRAPSRARIPLRQTYATQADREVSVTGHQDQERVQTERGTTRADSEEDAPPARTVHVEGDPHDL